MIVVFCLFLPKIERIVYSKEYTGANVSCILTGWGSTGAYAEGPYPNTLQEVHTTTLSNEKCHSEFFFVNENNLCSQADNGKGGCGKYPLIGKKLHTVGKKPTKKKFQMKYLSS